MDRSRMVRWLRWAGVLLLIVGLVLVALHVEVVRLDQLQVVDVVNLYELPMDARNVTCEDRVVLQDRRDLGLHAWLEGRGRCAFIAGERVWGLG